MRARRPPTMERGGKAGSAFFEADRCRGRYACRVVLWLQATPRQKTPIPELQRSAHSPFRCFSDEKDRPTPETLYKGLESGVFNLFSDNVNTYKQLKYKEINVIFKVNFNTKNLRGSR